MNAKKIFTLVAVSGVFVALAISAYLYYMAFTANTSFSQNEVYVYIPTDASYEMVLEEVKPFVTDIDKFDFDPKNLRAGIGILLQHPESRQKGFGSEALELVIAYAFTHLQLHQLYANISTENEVSLALFAKFGFETIGIKKQWNKVGNSYKDEWLVQLINPNS